MKKRLLSLLLAMVMLVGLLPMGALAAGDPTEIATKEQLAEIQKTAGDYILMANIELDADWTPLADSYKAVHLDGNGYTITLNGKPLFEKINSDSTYKRQRAGECCPCFIWSW